MKLIAERIIVLVLLVQGCMSSLYAQKGEIAKLKTEKEVLKYIDSVMNYRNLGFRFYDRQEYIDTVLYDSLKVKPYYICDFDNNGYADLLFNGFYDYTGSLEEYVIMDFGKNNLKVFMLNKLEHDPMYYKIIKIKNTKVVIRFQYLKEDLVNKGIILDEFKDKFCKRGGNLFKVDTLVSKFGAWIEYNENTNKKKPVNISFEISTGEYQTYLLSVDLLNRSIISNFRNRYTISLVLNLKGILKQESLQNTLDIIHYVDIAKYEDTIHFYNGSGNQCFLTVDFSDGSQKKITDLDGGWTNFSLDHLYKVLYRLKKYSEWEKVEDIFVYQDDGTGRIDGSNGPERIYD